MLFWGAEKEIDALGTSHLHLTITGFTVAQKKRKTNLASFQDVDGERFPSFMWFYSRIDTFSLL